MSRFAVLSLVLASLAFAGEDGGVLPPRAVQVRAVPATAKLGEPFVEEIVVTHDVGQRYELVPPGDLGDFDLGTVERHRVDGQDASTTTFKVTLSAFQLGALKTPGLALEITDAHGTAQVPVGSADVTVVSSLPSDAKDKGEALYDVREPEEVAVRTWRLLYVLGGIIAAGVLGWLLWRAWRDWKTRQVLAVAPPKPLHQRTIEALDALAKENLPGEGRVREYFFRVSEIVRGYLGELYAFEALECTTPELLEKIRARTTPGLPIEELTSFASQSDFVRYAKAVPSADECKVVLEFAYRTVHATTAAQAALLQQQRQLANQGHGSQRVP